MALRLEFLNIIIPIKEIKKKFPGGWEACLELHRESIGHNVWNDDHLFRNGAMDSMGIELILDFWKKNGFSGHKKQKGQVVWHDLCVVDRFEGPTLPCSWLEWHSEHHAVSLKGTAFDVNSIVDRDNSLKIKLKDMFKT